MFKFISFGVVSLASLAAVGCQSSGPRSPQVVRSPDPAVVCDQCNTMWVQRPVHTDKGRPDLQQYRWAKAPVCPECKQAAEGHFTHGAPTACKTCGGSLRVVTPETM